MITVWLQRAVDGKFQFIAGGILPFFRLSAGELHKPNSEHNEPNSEYIKTVSLEEIAAP
ncbi:hypothetical protein [Scytonema hofmannii]|uniref:hypothetical protein n=1 Tax=Scytonema hofmannii TaxID=34078 RepID=UPI000344F3A6|nr:hypothetical protein [Scytonema hofmannii]